jgi:hypothetical protein
MGTSQLASEILPSDLTIEEELATLDEEAVFEMTNLPVSRTGISGILFLSTAMASHTPRVKYFVKAGRSQPSFSVLVGSDRVLSRTVFRNVC